MFIYLLYQLRTKLGYNGNLYVLIHGFLLYIFLTHCIAAMVFQSLNPKGGCYICYCSGKDRHFETGLLSRPTPKHHEFEDFLVLRLFASDRHSERRSAKVLKSNCLLTVSSYNSGNEIVFLLAWSTALASKRSPEY